MLGKRKLFHAGAASVVISSEDSRTFGNVPNHTYSFVSNRILRKLLPSGKIEVPQHFLTLWVSYDVATMQ
jgi:hypothetical protein